MTRFFLEGCLLLAKENKLCYFSNSFSIQWVWSIQQRSNQQILLKIEKILKIVIFLKKLNWPIFFSSRRLATCQLSNDKSNGQFVINTCLALSCQRKSPGKLMASTCLGPFSLVFSVEFMLKNHFLTKNKSFSQRMSNKTVGQRLKSYSKTHRARSESPLVLETSKLLEIFLPEQAISTTCHDKSLALPCLATTFRGKLPTPVLRGPGLGTNNNRCSIGDAQYTDSSWSECVSSSTARRQKFCFRDMKTRIIRPVYKYDYRHQGSNSG